jgi:D-glycero-alpha-D-manno-heptose-7-phosphate kinase
MKLFISKTPLRISLFGGGTDLKSYYKKENGAVMSFSINKFLYVILKKNERLVDFKYRINWSKTEFANKINEIEHPIVREVFRMFKIDFPVEVSTFSDIPANTGLGSSSAFAVGLIHCISKFLNLKFSKNKIAEIAAKIEIDILKRNIGKQDHFASAFGGFNIIKFNKSEKVTVKKLKVSQQIVNKFNKSFLVFFLNKKRDASKILSNQKKLQKENFSSLDKIKKNVFMAEKLIKKKDPKIIENFGIILSEGWHWKKINNKSVSYKVVDKLYKEGIRLGSYGGKLLGAGGGGYFLFLTNSKSKKKMKSKFSNFSTIDVEIYQSGTEIIYEHK